MQVCMEKIPLDCVYAVHPHPTNDRYFGILADHTPSGTVHCYCYATKQPISVSSKLLSTTPLAWDMLTLPL